MRVDDLEAAVHEPTVAEEPGGDIMSHGRHPYISSQTTYLCLFIEWRRRLSDMKCTVMIRRP